MTVRLPSAPAIEALNRLDFMERVEGAFSERYGFVPSNLSHWNPEPGIARQLAALGWNAQASRTITDYLYPYEVPYHEPTLAKLGEPLDRGCVFTPSGTTSIVNVIAYLSLSGHKRIVGMAPYYFTVEECARTYGLSFSRVYIGSDPTRYLLPDPDGMQLQAGDAVWLTSPVYSASCYFKEAELRAWAAEVRAAGATLVIDESLAFADRAVVRALNDTDNVIAIYVPHKALALNAVRCSFFTVPPHLLHAANQWSDVFAGGLAFGGERAIKHFCSPQFDQSVEIVRRLIASSHRSFRTLVSNFEALRADAAVDGHFVMLFAPKVDQNLEFHGATISKLVHASAASFIPATRYGFPSALGFGLRINLFRLNDEMFGGLYRLADALSSLSSTE